MEKDLLEDLVVEETEAVELEAFLRDIDEIMNEYDDCLRRLS